MSGFKKENTMPTTNMLRPMTLRAIRCAENTTIMPLIPLRDKMPNNGKSGELIILNTIGFPTIVTTLPKCLKPSGA